jgi:hypothetical protein
MGVMRGEALSRSLAQLSRGKADNGAPEFCSHPEASDAEEEMARSIGEIMGVMTHGIRGNTTQEKQWVESLPKEMREQAQAQLLMQREQELVQQGNQIFKAADEAGKSITRNIGT